MTPRGRIKLGVFCLLAGAVINIALAFGCAIWVPRHIDHAAALSDREAVEFWSRFHHPEWATQPETGARTAAFGQELVLAQVSRNPARMLQADPLESERVFEYRIGWPFKSFAGFDQQETLVQQQVIHRVGLTPVNLKWLGLNRSPLLPYGPLWPGLMVNTLFFAAIVWMIVRTPPETRRRLRQWRGLCEKCASSIDPSAQCGQCAARFRLQSTAD